MDSLRNLRWGRATTGCALDCSRIPGGKYPPITVASHGCHPFPGRPADTSRCVECAGLLARLSQNRVHFLQERAVNIGLNAICGLDERTYETGTFASYRHGTQQPHDCAVWLQSTRHERQAAIKPNHSLIGPEAPNHRPSKPGSDSGNVVHSFI